MNRIIEFYYNMIGVMTCVINNKIHINYDNKKYLLLKTNRKQSDLMYILKFIDEKYNKIMFNKFGNIITQYNNNNNYILVENKYKNEEIMLQDLLNKKIYIKEEKERCSELLAKKIDYIIYKNKMKKISDNQINQSIDYYVSLTENAIAYLNSIEKNRTEKDNYICLCHYRIKTNKKTEFYNPVYLVFDHPAREISEYLKMIFMQKKYSMEIIDKIISECNFSSYGYSLLYGRMLYPSFYFDEILKEDNYNEIVIKNIITRAEEYERYINMIYNIILKKNKIIKVDWL